MIRNATSLLVGLIASASLMSAAAGVDFDKDIRPILSENCFHCHGPDANERKADLRLDTREGAFADLGDYAAVVPRDLGKSELIARITHIDPDEVMPPRKSKLALTPREIALLEQWIREGAPWAEHWAFIPPKHPPLPEIETAPDREAVRNQPKRSGGTKQSVRASSEQNNRKSKIENPIDRFVLARLEAANLAPSPRADKATLIRRVTLDLTGLPPTPEEVDAFLADHSPGAYEKVVDRLLASPRYGERMAWDWMDAARYADTSGFQGDPERTMWPWRDWVVAAFNANMPYDQFTIEQLAGDLLPDATREQVLATGFNRNNMHNGEGGRIPEETRVENIFDRVETTSTLWLGLTMTCARCHDHKYDRVTQRDYYALYDFFNQTSEAGKKRGGQVDPVLDMSTEAEKARVTEAGKKVNGIAEKIETFELKKYPRPEGAPLTESEAVNLPGNLPRYIGKTEPAKRGVNQLLEAVGYFEDKDPPYAKLLKQQLAAVRARDSAANNITRVMVLDTIAEPRETFVLLKGSYQHLTDTKVRAALPASLAPAPDAGLTRLDLARWLVSTENPLAARVTVNRWWQSIFGTGLVKTVEDFGVQGERPSHPALLDWLATGFMDSGWDVKSLYRKIVTSATYRQSSKITPAMLERDPENRLLARGPRYRLPSWMLRDQALAASGLLNGTIGGPSVKPYQPEGIWEEATFGKKTYDQDHGQSLYRRTLYVYWRRIVGPTMLFDNSARQTCTVKNFHTNTPLHALTTLNDITYVEAARAMAERVMQSSPRDPERVETAFRLATARRPASAETRILLARLAALKKHYADDKDAAHALLAVGESKRNESLNSAEHAAWTGLCSLMLNLDETLTKQ